MNCLKCYSLRRNLLQINNLLLRTIVNSIDIQPCQQLVRPRFTSTNASIPNPARIDTSRFNRTHYCGLLSPENIGQHVSISGWIQVTRFKNFLIVRDVKGLVQVCFDEDFLADPKRAELVANLKQESVVSVKGVVRKRPQGQENPKMPTGQVEIKCDHIEVLSQAKAKLPFEINDYNKPGEAVRLKYRYLDLRFLFSDWLIFISLNCH